MTVYVLIAEAVVDHGVLGVFTTELAARAVAERVWRESDGHHEFRVEPLELDVAYKPQFGLLYSDLSPKTTKPAAVRVLPEPERL